MQAILKCVLLTVAPLLPFAPIGPGGPRNPYCKTIIKLQVHISKVHCSCTCTVCTYVQHYYT